MSGPVRRSSGPDMVVLRGMSRSRRPGPRIGETEEGTVRLVAFLVVARGHPRDETAQHRLAITIHSVLRVPRVVIERAFRGTVLVLLVLFFLVFLVCVHVVPRTKPRTVGYRTKEGGRVWTGICTLAPDTPPDLSPARDRRHLHFALP